MSLAIFDLDNTLIGGDSDHLWGEFLIQKGVVNADYYRQQNDKYYEAYKQGNLDIMAFLQFSLRPLADNPLEKMLELREEFMRDKIELLLLPKSFELLSRHREQGHYLLIITATNRFVTEPIAQRLGVDELLATEPEFVDGKYTGSVFGTPCYQAGKVTRLRQWQEKQAQTKGETWFYSDSHNDLPLLELVDHPVVVDADDILLEQAKTRNWLSISLR
ncbi:MAG: HAD-IB family hydrolase [Gammaproteobacteria bacterium]|nr:HAD-IB family hydrolase [Gammaproteobacteria bacterium]